jgi:hypothetical protein
LILFVRILATDKRFLMKLLGGKHTGIWLMCKNHKHYWRHSTSQTKTCTLIFMQFLLYWLQYQCLWRLASVHSVQCAALKNCLRATMGDERLWNLSLLHIHRTRNLSVKDLINKFAVRKNRRLDFIKLPVRVAGHDDCMCLHELWNFILWMFLSYIFHLW